MSATLATITVAAPPTTEEVAADIVVWIGGQSGVLTDLNNGSQIRTDSEAIGSVTEMQGVIAQAEAFQAMVYAAFAAFNIFPLLARPSIGTVTFITGSAANPPVATSPILIPALTIVQTLGGIQYQTTANAVIPTGATSVTAPIQAVVAGAGGNAVASSITQIASALSNPLQVFNTAPTTGGEDAETPSQTMARFTAKVASIGLSTPVAIANGVIGVVVSGTAEEVEFATVFEPWIQQVQQGVANPTPGFDVFVDNGSGSASSNLLTAVSSALSGNAALGQDGFRPAGVPFSVLPVSPLFAIVVVSGTATEPALDASVVSLATSAAQGYFSGLAFGQIAELSQLTAAIANQVAGNVTSLGIQLLNVSGVAVNALQPLGFQRVIVQNLSVNFN